MGDFLFGRLLFGYGERIRGVIIATILLIGSSTCVYIKNGINTGLVTAQGEAILTHDWWDSLYFSVVTFTTLGYGDLHPTESLRLLAAGEALAGAFLMAMFVVILARKFTR